VRDYELTLILKPELGEDGVSGLAERVGGWITDYGGSVVSVTPAGRKRLAYPINHSRDGSYVVMQVRSRPDALPEVERSLKLSEDVLRHAFLRR
jgi:small subunit ribosomal protein S6